MRSTMIAATVIATMLVAPVARADDGSQPAYRYERRWAWWVPYTVMGGSLVVAVAGAAMYMHADHQLTAFDRAFLEQCPAGCPQVPAALQDQADAAHRNRTLAIGMFVGAGALLVAGNVMGYLNRPYRVTPQLDVTAHGATAGLSFAFD